MTAPPQTTGVIPETRYAQSGKLHIAFQALGDGTIDLVLVPGFVSNVEYGWEDPSLARFHLKLASFSRLILFDKRGTGLSDRVPDDALPTLEERMDDVRAVMDAAGSERTVILGVSEGGPMSALFAAAHPERTIALVLYGAPVRYAWAPDFPWGTMDEDLERGLKDTERAWGTVEYATEDIREWFAPSKVGDQRFVRWFATYCRMAASPGAAAALFRMNHEIDVRHVLPAIRVPTLVLDREGSDWPRREVRRYAAERIPGAKYVELPGRDHCPWTDDSDSLIQAISHFVTGGQPEIELDRVLATVLFTDIVGSTQRAAELGDGRWRDLLEDHHRLVRAQLARYRGTEVDTAGDGFLATFDGPARAIRCARAIVDSVRELGIELRAGLHSGECELVEGKVRGIAVHTGARVAALAGPSEVLVSQTVRDLVAGSGLVFEDAGEHELKGVPDRWHLYRVVGGQS